MNINFKIKIKIKNYKVYIMYKAGYYIKLMKNLMIY